MTDARQRWLELGDRIHRSLWEKWSLEEMGFRFAKENHMHEKRAVVETEQEKTAANKVVADAKKTSQEKAPPKADTDEKKES